MVMHYYEIWVRSDMYRGKEALTYSYDRLVVAGSIVTVPLKNKQVLGVVVKEVPKPVFFTKPIIALYELPPLPAQSLSLATWLRDFYESPVGVVMGLFIPPAIHNNHERVYDSIDESRHFAGEHITLTTEQADALAGIAQPDTYILHGRTGSGKTQVYIELAERAFGSGESVLVLSPEIGLTSQLAQRFRENFGDRVFVLHSQLRPREREQIWTTILTATEPLVIIGPRSALFSPFATLGLIIIDEAHDQAYKQESAPYYHSVRVASQLRQVHSAILVLGSATPSVTDYYLALARTKPIIRMTTIAQSEASPTTEVRIIDLKDKQQFTRSTHLSDTLIEAVDTSLSKHEQALLYLNRRGTARVILCTACGWQALCPRCDLPLAYHGDSFTLRCHTCGYRSSPPLSCPQCNNQSITLKSFGTKAIVDEVQRIFPEATVARFDTDTIKSERLEQQYDRIQHGEVDILVGTQMLAKGLDLPLLSTLGVIMADTSLYLPDYTAKERTYQLLAQVVGRVGRGHTVSRTIVQTYYPESGLLDAALHDEWDRFYQEEIAERKTYHFPPFCYLLKISTRSATAAGAERNATKFARQLRARSLPLQVEEPTPAFHEKIGGQYVWQIVIKAGRRSDLLEVLNGLPKGWSYDLDPSDLL